MHTHSKVILPILLLIALTHSVCAAPTPMGTAFNYQGYLTDKNGNPINGQYDLKFDLYSVANGGNSLATDTRKPVAVNKGLFSTNVDFSFIFDGNAYWLEIGVRPNGNLNNYDVQSPRLQIRPVPYALFASNAVNAETAATANGVSANAIGGAGLQNNSITASKIASGEVVKSLNGLSDHVTLAAGLNLSLTTNGNTLTIQGSPGSAGWLLTGNAGTTPGVDFLGTTDNTPLDLRAYGTRGMQLSYVQRGGGGAVAATWGINVLGGLNLNSIGSGVIGGTIAGGGFASGSSITPQYKANTVSADCGTIGGGAGNIAGATYGTIGGGANNQIWSAYGIIPGGKDNWISGIGGFAAGQNARVFHDNSFVWSDGQLAFSSGPNSFDIYANGGMYLSQSTSLNWGNSQLNSDQGGAIELGNSLGNGNIPYIDFHFGVGGAQDFNVRLVNDGDRQLTCSGNLNVSGSASVCSLTIRGGCDLAEPFQMSEQEIPKGSVVVIDDEHPGRLKRSAQAYDTRVAGIVSGANGIHPGISLKQEGVLDEGENVALSGRGYVKADASFGAIKPGDLLTTSATPGHAMKVTDHARAQGAILGKAMSALSEGTGMVLVLVTLQ